MKHFYLRLGPMRNRPYHLVGDGGEVSLCGQVRRGDEGVTAIVSAPEPMPDGLICERCHNLAILQTIKQVAEVV